MINMQNIRALLQAQQQQAAPKSLVEFRAGILTQTGTTVKADHRRGKLVLVQGPDGILHLQWFLRPGDTKEFDIPIMPGGATIERIQECKDGRVYLLRITQTQARRWFWMQEPSEEKDEEWIKNINDYIKSPPAPGGAGDEAESALQRMLMSEMGQAEPGEQMRSSGPVVTPSSPSAATSAAEATPSGPGGQQQQQQAAALAQLQAMAQEMRRTILPLPEVLDSGRVLEALDDGMVGRLTQYLPEGQQTPEQLREQLRSPQFQQTVGRLSAILNSAQYGALMASLGLPLGADMGVPAFLDAIQKESDKEEGGGGN